MFDPRDAPAARPVLGVDPGLSRCGWGAVVRAGGDVRPVAYGVLRTPPSDSLPDRLAALASELRAVFADVAPSVIAVERVLFQANVRTAISVGQASGLALAVAGERGLPVVHYSPNEVKLAVTGWGAADKAQVQDMVCRQLGLTEVPPPDAADALALAVCHAFTGRTRAAMHGDTGAGTGYQRAVAAALAADAARGAR